MSKKNPYVHSDKYVLRAPLFSLDFYKDLTNKALNIDELKEYFKNPIISEAIYLASPSLFGRLEKLFNNEISDFQKIEKLKYAFLKYLIRMSTRCTPFGMFAGCSVGKFGDETKICLSEPRNNFRYTRLDMNYLNELSIALVKIPKIKSNILFYPNTSIYRVGNQIRYVQYTYIGSRRLHKVLSVQNQEYLEAVLTLSVPGKRINDLAESLVNDEILKADAENFIEELIKNQLLISELDPSVTGAEHLKRITQLLRPFKGIEEINQNLQSLSIKLTDLDNIIGNPIDNYRKITLLLEKLTPNFDVKYLYQTDLIINSVKNKLDNRIVNIVKKGISILNKICLPQKNQLIVQFKNKFIQRYGNREIPLAIALDPEIGIGFTQNINTGTINPLVDDLILEDNSDTVANVSWSSVDTILHKLISAANIDGEYSIKLSDTDFQDCDENWDDLPETLSALIQMPNRNDDKILLTGFWGSSAANLLARFCYGDNEIREFVESIIERENSITKKIYVEIAHLPQARVGNVLCRPALREYEIPYLSKSNLKLENQIEIEDIMVSVKRGEIVLKSIKLGKEIHPMLTNAHNYAVDQLPIYHFLSAMQYRSKRGGLSMKNVLQNNIYYGFIPRIEFDRVILNEATWQFYANDINHLQEVDNDERLLQLMLEFRERNKIPVFVSLFNEDNLLLINLKNPSCIRMLLLTVKNLNTFQLKESLFMQEEDEGAISTMESGTVQHQNNYSNEILIPFFKEN